MNTTPGGTLRPLLLALSLLLLPAAARAQQASLTGIVTDAETGFALAGVSVRIVSEDRRAISNGTGRFTLVGLPAGRLVVEAVYLGYARTTQTVELDAGDVGRVTFHLAPEAIALEGVTVTGNRRGQAAALNQQLNAPNVTNVVAADQIGRFPDQNIGDAMKRIPGLVVMQDQGEARFGLVRGTEPRFNSVMINGERIPSAEAEIREVQLDLIPADMVSAIEVNKTLTPDMDADAIGGSVNIVTRAAPTQRRASVTLGSGYNFLSDEPMAVGSAVLADRFVDGRLGVVLSGSYFDHKLGSDNIEGEWDLDGSTPYLAEFQIREYQVQRIRRSASAALDYRLSEGNSLTLRGIYNWRDDWENRFRQVIKLDEPSGGGQITEIERETKGGIGNDRVDFRRLEDQRMWSASLAGEHLGSILGGARFTWSAQVAQASEKRPNERYINFVAEDLTSNVDVSDPGRPRVSVVGGMPDLDAFELAELTEEHQSTRDRDFNARADLELPFGGGDTQLRFGGRVRSKSKLRDNDFFEYDPNGQFSTLAEVPTRDYTNPDFLASGYRVGTLTDNRFLGDLDLGNGAFAGEPKFDEFAADNFEADETVLGGYVMLTQRLGGRASAILGVRVENTDVSYEGNAFDEVTEQVSPTSGSSRYTDVFPSAQLRYELDERSVLRAAWTNTLARPGYFQLTPFRVIEDNEIEIGNPDLDPTTSMNLDLMFERYFSNVGLFSAGAFYKDIDGFIIETVEQDGVVDGVQFDEVVRPINGGGARLVGFEVAVQRTLDFLPGALAGFGVYANYTFTDSEVDGLGIEGRENEDLPLPGTSRNTFNGSLSYDYGRFSLRGSVNFQDSFIDPGEVGDEAFFDRYYDAQTTVDLNGSVVLTPTARFFFEANNLTNEPLRYYQGVVARLMQEEYYDTRIQAGLKIDLR
jgi:TonB-dependent receptor